MKFCFHKIHYGNVFFNQCSYCKRKIQFIQILLALIILLSCSFVNIRPIGFRYSEKLLNIYSKIDSRSEAIVSLLTGDLYLPAVLVLGYSLKKHNASNNRDMILLIPQGVTNCRHHIKMVKAIGWKPIYVKPIPIPGSVVPRLVDALIKLHAWSLTSYKIVAAIDADSFLMGSIEEAFQRIRNNSQIPLLAVDDAGVSHDYRKDLHPYFNSGVLFFRPNLHDFEKLVYYSTNLSYYQLEYPQQNLLNRYYHKRWAALPEAFNLLDHLNDRHPIWFQHFENARIIHYAGPFKPWSDLSDERNLTNNTAFIWRRYFLSLMNENGWTRDDFLISGASDQLRNLSILSDFKNIKDKKKLTLI